MKDRHGRNGQQLSAGVDLVRQMTDETLIARAWAILTNIRLCGGGTRKGRQLAQRRVRRLGWRFFLLPRVGEDASEWGMIAPGESGPDGAVVGVSLGHCAHQLGGGNATRGWTIYHA